MDDLEATDAKMVAEAIAQSESLDSSVSSVISSFPTLFHASMIEDLRSMDAEDHEKILERQVEEAETKLWHAKLANFQSLLAKDMATVQRASEGQCHLKDRLLDIDRLNHAFQAHPE